MTTPEPAPVTVTVDPATHLWLTTLAAADHHGSLPEAAAAVLEDARRHAEQTIIDAGIDIGGGWDEVNRRLLR